MTNVLGCVGHILIVLVVPCPQVPDGGVSQEKSTKALFGPKQLENKVNSCLLHIGQSRHILFSKPEPHCLMIVNMVKSYIQAYQENLNHGDKKVETIKHILE